MLQVVAEWVRVADMGMGRLGLETKPKGQADGDGLLLPGASLKFSMMTGEGTCWLYVWM